jgi:hypothetical protein
MARRTIAELEDELKHRDRRIDEQREEIDRLTDLVRRFGENAEDYSNTMEAWRDTFDMTMTDKDTWTWEPFWDKRSKLIADYNDLVHRWNRFLPLINGRTQPVGRPLGASDAQVDEVKRLHKRGVSLRGICDHTSLSFRTVRTILGRIDGTDRTTRKHRDRAHRIEIDKQQQAEWKRQKRTGDALPKRAQAVVEQGRALVTEAKGLGRSK